MRARRGRASEHAAAPQRVELPSPAPSDASTTVRRIWVWVGSGPSGSWAVDGEEMRQWIAQRCDLGITDVVFQLNWKRDAVRTHSFSPNSQYATHDGDFSRLRAIAEAFHGRGVDSHVMVFLSPYARLIEGAAALVRNIAAQVPIRSAMLDCEEWWSGPRAQGVSAVREHFMSGWTWANAEKLGVGVTGLAAAGGSGGIGSLLEAVDYGCPQMYASIGNYGVTLATTGLRLALQDWARYRASLGSKPIVIGQTARPRFPPAEGRAAHPAPETILDAARMRAMLDVVLQLGAAGDGGPGATELAFWSDDLLFAGSADRRQLVQHLCEAARGAGLRRDGV